MKTNYVIALAASMLLFSSCAINRKINLSKIDLNVGYSNFTSVLLVVQDQRDPVRNGKQKQSWCGRVEIYNIQTESRNSVSQEFAQFVANSIIKNGGPVEKLVIEPTADFNSQLLAFPKRPESRLLFMTIKNWETNCTPLFSSMRYEVITNFEFKVYDKSGKMIANEEAGDSKIKEQGAGLNMAVLQALAETSLQEQISKLFNKESIKSSLQRENQGSH